MCVATAGQAAQVLKESDSTCMRWLLGGRGGILVVRRGGSACTKTEARQSQLWHHSSLCRKLRPLQSPHLLRRLTALRLHWWRTRSSHTRSLALAG